MPDARSDAFTQFYAGNSRKVNEEGFAGGSVLWHRIGNFIDVQPPTSIGVRPALQNQRRQTPQRLMLNVQQAKLTLTLLGKSLKPFRCERASFRLHTLNLHKECVDWAERTANTFRPPQIIVITQVLRGAASAVIATRHIFIHGLDAE